MCKVFLSLPAFIHCCPWSLFVRERDCTYMCSALASMPHVSDVHLEVSTVCGDCQVPNWFCLHLQSRQSLLCQTAVSLLFFFVFSKSCVFRFFVCCLPGVRFTFVRCFSTWQSGFLTALAPLLSLAFRLEARHYWVLHALGSWVFVPLGPLCLS